MCPHVRTVYGSLHIILRFRCKDPRYLVKYKEDEAAWEVGASCQWNTAWSKELSELTCQLTYCSATFTIPDGYLVEQDGGVPRLGEVKELRCPPNAKLLEPTKTKEEARDVFSVRCRSDGTYQEYEEWMACRYIVFCPPAAHPPPGGHRTFLTNGEGSKKYGTEVEYRCAPGSQFLLASGEFAKEIINTCTWAKTWQPLAELPPCVITHCPEPPRPPFGHSMVEATRDWTAVGEHKVYLCDGSHGEEHNRTHTKFFESNRMTSELKLFCRNDGTFAPVEEWPKCLEGNFIAEPFSLRVDVECPPPPGVPGTPEHTGEEDMASVAITTYTYPGPAGSQFVLRANQSSQDLYFLIWDQKPISFCSQNSKLLCRVFLFFTIKKMVSIELTDNSMD